MDSDAPIGVQDSKQSASDSIRNWLAAFIRYFELRVGLIGLESKEVGVHLLMLALLFAGTLVCFVGALVMLVVFLLFIMTLILRWEWDCGAHTTLDVLRLNTIVTSMMLRSKTDRPNITKTLDDIKKDREWL